MTSFSQMHNDYLDPDKHNINFEPYCGECDGELIEQRNGDFLCNECFAVWVLDEEDGFTFYKKEF